LVDERGIRPAHNSWSTHCDNYVDNEKNFKEEAAYFANVFQKSGASSILEVGCGTGRHAIYLAKKGFSLTCTDISSGMLREAAERAEREGCSISFIQTSIQKLSKRVPERFDGVLCAGSVSAHLLDDVDLMLGLKNIYDVLNPGGMAIFENKSLFKGEEGTLEFGPLTAAPRVSGESDTLYLRVLKYGKKIVTHNIVAIEKREGNWNYSVRSFDLRKDITRSLEEKLPGIGFSKIDVNRGVIFEKTGHDEMDIVIAVK